MISFYRARYMALWVFGGGSVGSSLIIHAQTLSRLKNNSIPLAPIEREGWDF